MGESYHDEARDLSEAASATGPTLEAFIDGYLAAGWSLFPVHSIRQGRCTCGKGDCSSPGKHPIATLVPQGFKDASTDRVTIDHWLDNAPWMNIGLPTGRSQGIVVVDIDTDKGGLDSMEALEERHGTLPATRMVRTGGGGFHLVFQVPEVELRNSAGELGKGVDIRAEGGYVVAPLSSHLSGGVYRWDDVTAPILPMPQWMVTRLSKQRVIPPTPRHIYGAPTDSDIFSQGGRNNALTKVGGSLRRQGLAEDTILAMLLLANERQCRPPLDEREVERIARSVARYDAAPMARIGPTQQPRPKPVLSWKRSEVGE